MPTSNVTAVLGPTNTGKTHLAAERMLASRSGMIGLPLRLLAREVFDRVRARAGEAAVALVTGEEKIVPPEPRYWVCTVEAMPSDVEVSFLAIDEVQLAADLERGHIFTDRIFHRRGRDETMLLGAQTMRGAIEQLLPGTNFITRPRFSKLTYAGQKKLSRLPRRSAIVAFSAEAVYGLAEVVRRQRGGAAVVLGALSPRTRNAQVGLFQTGDVDYLVATDAIGMGLNMDVDHLAFAQTRKFDGFQFRNLTPAELGQIAGRAGRHMNDGTFGVTGEVEPFEQEVIDRLEEHRFDPVRVVQWRNRGLDFSSIEALKASLAEFPKTPGLTRAQATPDVTALETLSNEADIAQLTGNEAAVKRLWEVCQIPDYRNISSAEHASIVGRIFRFLMSSPTRIPEDWFARQLSYCNRSEGGIDTLSNRIAHVRTWTFVANRSDWLADPLRWQAETREIEDRLSDALHERLTQRFVDRRTSVLMKRLQQKEEIVSSVEEDGGIQVEGEYIGHVKGFHFIPDGSVGPQGKALKAAWLKTVAHEISLRAQAVTAAPDTALSLSREGAIRWQGADIAKLAPGPEPLKPRIQLMADEQLAGPERETVQARLEKYLARYIASVLEPLVKLAEAEGVTGLARGIAFRLTESLGVLDREEVAADVKTLGQPDRAALRQFGVRFGAFHIFMPELLKPRATELRLLLWSLGTEREGGQPSEGIPRMPGQGLTSAPFDPAVPKGFYRVSGFKQCGPRVVRIDMLERLADMIRPRVFWKPQRPEEPRPQGSMPGGGFTVIPDMMSLVGCSGEEFSGILRALGFKSVRRPAPLKPVEVSAPTAPAEDPAAEAPAAEAAPAAEPPAEGPPPEAVETAPEAAAAPEPVASPEPTAPAEPVTSVEPVASAESQTPAEPAAEPLVSSASVPAEPHMVDVWWPKETGPFRRERRDERKPHGKSKPRHDRARHEKPQGGKPQGEKPREAERPPAEERRDRRPARPPRKQKPIEAPPSDSPFAVLQSLKAELIRRKS